MCSSPPSPHVDPRDHEEKMKEAEEVAALNNQFVRFIDKVHHLQQQNQVLETQLKVLLEQEPYEADIEGMVEELSRALRQQVDSLAQEHEMLEAKLVRSEVQVEEKRRKYEDEIQRKADAEEDFVAYKKDVDDAHLHEVELQLELENVMGELDFLTRAFEEVTPLGLSERRARGVGRFAFLLNMALEIKEFESQVQNSRVFLQEKRAQTFDMSQIAREVQTQYEEMAARSREEAEAWHRTKVSCDAVQMFVVHTADMAAKVQKHEEELKENRREVADTLRVVQKLFREVETLKRKRDVLRTEAQEAEDRDQQVREEAGERVRQLKEALLRAKQDMMQQVHDYQDLMNLKDVRTERCRTTNGAITVSLSAGWENTANAADRVRAPFTRPSVQGSRPVRPCGIDFPVAEGKWTLRSTEHKETQRTPPVLPLSPTEAYFSGSATVSSSRCVTVSLRHLISELLMS
ncbi:keratin type IIs-like, partial [Scleropages formosus]